MANSLVFCNYYDALNKDNYMFKNANTSIGDDLLRPMIEMKRYANQRLIEVNTTDVTDINAASAVVFIDMPEPSNIYFKKSISLQKPMYLITFESELIKPDNFDLNNHKFFDKIFTFNDSLIDNKKYFKINYTYVFPKNIFSDASKKEKLCTIIAGNKKSRHPLELYSKRIEAIRWFEKNHPENFDLYGVGWDNEYRFEGNRIIRAFNRIHLLTKVFTPHYPSYRGKIAAKKPILEKYKFAICYENARDIPGYITEKIFDCFFAGCVPIYLGANNVLDHIPEECFIDRRRFNSYEGLYQFMVSMSTEQYNGYIKSIENFLQSEKAYSFSCEHFANTILKECLSGKCD